ncbi:MAG: hypothetical protein [Bacteriophage sp.]|nr:MAG: hypothetical protein [Bacteriophage sp.]
MNIKLSDKTEISNANAYLNGQYQEELVIQISDEDVSDILKLFQSEDNLTTIQVYEDDQLQAYYSGYTRLKSLRVSDNMITIILMQVATLSSILDDFQDSVVNVNNGLTDLDKQINPVFDWANSSLEECKSEKYKEIGKACEDTIHNGFEVKTSEGTKKFSGELEDQINLMGIYPYVQGGAPYIPYHADGEFCKFYSAEDFNTIMSSAFMFKTYNTTLCNALNRYIDACQTKEELEKVEFNMDVLPSEYKEHIMELFNQLNQITQEDNNGTDDANNTETK